MGLLGIGMCPMFGNEGDAFNYENTGQTVKDGVEGKCLGVVSSHMDQETLTRLKEPRNRTNISRFSIEMPNFSCKTAYLD